MKRLLTALALFALLLTTGCASTPRPTFEEWTASWPAGFQAQLEVARHAEHVYHTIADTPIRELQTEKGARELGDLVTQARDKYRHWQSYGNYHVPRTYPGSLWDSGFAYHQGKPGKQGNIVTFVFELGFRDGSEPAIEGTIVSSRGRVIFGGRHGDERNWILNSPFNDILVGDRVADIPSLLAKIKR